MVSSPGPVPPINSSRCSRSSKLVMPTVCQAKEPIYRRLALRKINAGSIKPAL
jgi:hypothetical protein